MPEETLSHSSILPFPALESLIVIWGSVICFCLAFDLECTQIQAAVLAVLTAILIRRPVRVRADAVIITISVVTLGKDVVAVRVLVVAGQNRNVFYRFAAGQTVARNSIFVADARKIVTLWQHLREKRIDRIRL